MRDPAMEELRSLLLRVAGSRLSTDPDLAHFVDDAVQRAMATIWGKLTAGQVPDDDRKFLAWSATIVTNEIGQEVRRLNPPVGPRGPRRVPRDRTVALDAAPDGVRTPGESLAEEMRPPGEARLQHRELRELLTTELARSGIVSPESWTVLVRGYFEEWDDDALAAFLGKTRANIQVIRSRDLDKVRRDASYVERLRRIINGW